MNKLSIPTYFLLMIAAVRSSASEGGMTCNPCEADAEGAKKTCQSPEEKQDVLCSLIKTNSQKSQDLETQLNKLDRKLSKIQRKTKRKCVQCAYKQTASGSGFNITYDSHLTNINSFPSGGLNITTGVFTVPVSGIYQISYGAMLFTTSTDTDVATFIYIDNRSLGDQSNIWSSGTSGTSYDSGSRTLMLHLRKDQEVTIYCYDCTPSAYHVSFCITLMNQV